MTEKVAPEGPRVSASSESESEQLAEALATALCELDGTFHAGDVLLVTPRDGVYQGKLEGRGLDALLEHVLGSGAHDGGEG